MRIAPGLQKAEVRHRGLKWSPTASNTQDRDEANLCTRYMYHHAIGLGLV